MERTKRSRATSATIWVKGVQQKRPGTPQPESEDKQRRREANDQIANCMKKCKALIDNTTNAMATLEAELPKVATRGYPEEMQEWCRSKLRGTNVHIKENTGSLHHSVCESDIHCYH